MSSTTGAIRGGLAYVEAYLDDNPVTQGLAKLQGKVKRFQSTLSTMAAGTMGGDLPEPFAAIARFAQSPAGAFAALVGAAKFTADAREEMLRLSESCGVSVEKLSAYSYAARRAGLSNEALANGLKRLESKEFQSAMQGMGKGALGGMKGLTTATFAKLGSGDATDKLREFIKLTENMPTEEKIGLAKRLGLSELLPLINQGVDSLDAFTARAKALGLVMSEEDAKGGRKFAQAFGDLQDVLKSCVGQIGGALVPLITGLTNVIVPIVAAVRDWIKEHKYLTVALFLGSGAIVAGGIALKGLAIITGIASKAITVLQWAVKGLQVAFSVLSTAVSWLPMLANPWVLAGLAIAGVVAWIAKLSGAFDGLGALWTGLSTDFADSFGAIANALSKGDIQGAWNVVTAFIKTEWVRVTEYLGQVWGNFSDYFMGLLDKYAPWVSTSMRAMGKAWDWLSDHWSDGMKWLSGAWKTVCDTLEKAFGGAVKRVHAMWDGILDKIAEAQQAHDEKGLHHATNGGSEESIRRQAREYGLDPDQAVANARAHGKIGAEIDPTNAGGVHAANIRKQVAKDAAAEEERAFELRKKQRALDADTRLQAAHLELKKAIDAANAPGPEEKAKEKGNASLTVGQQTAVAGTFSGAVAGMLGGGGNQAIQLAQKQVDQGYEAIELQRKHIELMERQHDALKKIDESTAKAAEMTSGVV